MAIGPKVLFHPLLPSRLIGISALDGLSFEYGGFRLDNPLDAEAAQALPLYYLPRVWPIPHPNLMTALVLFDFHAEDFVMFGCHVAP